MELIVGGIVLFFLLGLLLYGIVQGIRQHGVKQEFILTIKDFFYEIIMFLWSIFCMPFIIIRNLFRWIFKR